MGTYNWLDLLAVHEYRHIVQNDKALQGYGRVLYTALGNAGLFLPLLTVPDWFAEGDAVSNETLLSSSGRGRIPNFDLGMRANLLAGKRFSYPKAVGGSYRDNVPNHYVLGYFLTTYLKRTYGPDVWSRVLTRNYRRFPWPFAFSASIKDETQLRTDDLYRKTMDDLTEIWQKQQAALTLTPATLYPTNAKIEKQSTAHPVFTNYRHPQFLTDSTILCVKSGLGDTPAWLFYPAMDRRKRCTCRGFPTTPTCCRPRPARHAGSSLATIPRWGQRVYSNIRMLDLNTGKLTRLTHRARYTVATLSPDNTKLVVVDNTTRSKTILKVLDAQTGNVLKTLANPNSVFYQHPRWAEDNQTIVVVTLKDNQKTIEQIDTRQIPLHPCSHWPMKTSAIPSPGAATFCTIHPGRALIMYMRSMYGRKRCFRSRHGRWRGTTLLCLHRETGWLLTISRPPATVLPPCH